VSYSGSPQGADPTPLLTERRKPNQDRPATGSPSRGQHELVHPDPRLTQRTHPGGGPPDRLLAISLAVARGFWGLARLCPGSALCAAADPAVAAGPPVLQPDLHRRAALDPGPGCRAAPKASLDGVRALLAAAGGLQHQPLRFPPGGAGHAATGDLGDRRSPPMDLGRADPAAPSRQQTCQKKGPLLEHWDDKTSGGSHRALAQGRTAAASCWVLLIKHWDSLAHQDRPPTGVGQNPQVNLLQRC